MMDQLSDLEQPRSGDISKEKVSQGFNEINDDTEENVDDDEGRIVDDAMMELKQG